MGPDLVAKLERMVHISERSYCTARTSNNDIAVVEPLPKNTLIGTNRLNLDEQEFKHRTPYKTGFNQYSLICDDEFCGEISDKTKESQEKGGGDNNEANHQAEIP